MSQTSPADTALLYRQLEASTSLSIVSDYLRGKQLQHAATSWQDMIARHIQPAVAEGTLLIDELAKVLNTMEEYGRQHVFLFQADADVAAGLMDRARVRTALETMGLPGLMAGQRIVDFPAEAEISQVRWGSAGGADTELVIKEVECHDTFKLADVAMTPEGMVKTYTRNRRRGINIARLHRDGRLEVRVASRQGLLRYGGDLLRFRKRIEAILPLDAFAGTSLRAAKDALWDHRSFYAGEIRFSEVAARNDDDFVLRAIGGNQAADVSTNVAAASSMEQFIDMDGRCEGFNLWFAGDYTPSGRDIHFLIAGEANEFAINGPCTPEDYEYVLAEIRSLNGG